jgi:hypothetical protein
VQDAESPASGLSKSPPAPNRFDSTWEIDEPGTLRLSWQAAPDQVCTLETSIDLKTWTTTGSFRTGLWRHAKTGRTGVSPDPHIATVILPVSDAHLHVRLRWSPE